MEYPDRLNVVPGLGAIPIGRVVRGSTDRTRKPQANCTYMCAYMCTYKYMCTCRLSHVANALSLNRTRTSN